MQVWRLLVVGVGGCVSIACTGADQAGSPPLSDGVASSTSGSASAQTQNQGQPASASAASSSQDIGSKSDAGIAADVGVSATEAGAVALASEIPANAVSQGNVVDAAPPGSSAQTAPARRELVVSGPGQYFQPAEFQEGIVDGASVIVERSTKYQVWNGFGGTFNEHGWELLAKLPESERKRALELLFDAEKGAHFSWGRLPVGACEYAVDRYSLDDVEGDYELEHFSLERDKQRLIPYVRAAQAVNPDLKLWAVPWSPPTWLKDNDAFDGGALLDDPMALTTYANYLAEYVAGYAELGIPIHALMPQNEPGFDGPYPSAKWSPEAYNGFIRDYLGPTFAQRKLDTEIWLGAFSSSGDESLMRGVMIDPAAAPYIQGFGGAWVASYFLGGLPGRFHLPVVQTQHDPGNHPYDDLDFNADFPPNDHEYALESLSKIQSWIRMGVNSYTAWNMVSDKQGIGLDPSWPKNALLIVDPEEHTLTPTPAYYAFRHLSQFVQPGAVRVATGAEGIGALAFQNPDCSVVTLVTNGSDAEQRANVQIGEAHVNFSVPGKGFATLTWPSVCGSPPQELPGVVRRPLALWDNTGYFIASNGTLYPYGVGWADASWPVVPLLKDAAGVVMSLNGGCAYTMRGEAYCWFRGANLVERVVGVDNVVDMATASDKTCALIADGTVRCWGSGDLAALESWAAGVRGATSLFVSQSGACVTTEDGALSCSFELPEALDGVTSVTQMRWNLGDTYGCTLGAGGAVACFGDNQYGQLGLGHANPQSTREPIAGTYVDVTVGDTHACVLDAAGVVHCWGADDRDALGGPAVDPFTCDEFDCLTTPQVVPGAPVLSAIATGASTTCGLAANDTVWCWGGVNYNGPVLQPGPWQSTTEACIDAVSNQAKWRRSYVSEASECTMDSDCVAVSLSFACNPACGEVSVPKQALAQLTEEKANFEATACGSQPSSCEIPAISSCSSVARVPACIQEQCWFN